MYILGISCYYHDSAVCLIRNGEIINAIQEERLTRIKHDNKFPKNSIIEILKKNNLSLSQIDKIVFFEKPFLKFERLLETYIGFAPNNEIPFLYKQSLALVMPTYLGPTNIPPLEAFFYETPVCYSDTPFFRESMTDSVFFMDLRDPNSLVRKLLIIKNDKIVTKDKIDKGKDFLDSWNDIDFYNKLLEIFSDYKNIRSIWN